MCVGLAGAQIAEALLPLRLQAYPHPRPPVRRLTASCPLRAGVRVQRKRVPHARIKSQGTLPCTDVAAESYVWFRGVGCDYDQPASRRMFMARRHLLRLLLAALSRPLYSVPTDVDPAQSIWLEHLTGAAGRRAPSR